MRTERGNTLVEAAIFVPLLLLLLLGLIEFGRLAYTYHTLQKALYGMARYIGTQQGVNFCDDGDATILAAKNYALTGTTDGSGNPILPNLSAEQVQIRIERYSTGGSGLEACDCSATGCDTAAGGRAPDFIVVSIPEGYGVQLRVPRLPMDPVLLQPQVRVPFGGT